MMCPYCQSEYFDGGHLDVCPRRPKWDMLKLWKWLTSKLTRRDSDWTSEA